MPDCSGSLHDGRGQAGPSDTWQRQHQRSGEEMTAKSLYRPIATVFLILFALGLIISFSWVFYLLLSVVLVFT